MSAFLRQKTIILLGLPIIAGMLSQSVINLIDAALVGQLGEASLAGVGIGSYTNFVAISLILGLSSGVQTLVARNRGQGQHNYAATPVHWGLLISFLVALPLSIIYIHYSDSLVAIMSEDSSVQDIASSYFDYRTAAMLAVGINLSFRGWWNGNKTPITYFKILVFTHSLNIVISYCLIFGHLGLPQMGAPGAGLGSAIAIYSGALINAVFVYKNAKPAGLLRWHSGSIIEFSKLLRLSIPHSLQQFFLALSICVLIWIIGQLGTSDQAIAHVLINLSLFLILPAVGLGIASTSLVSHAIGEDKQQEALRWGWAVLKTALAFMLLLSLPLWLIPETILGFFLQSNALIEQAVLPLQIAALAICLDAATIVLTQALFGVGANRIVFIISTCGLWGFYLPLAWLFGPALGFGLIGIWIIQLIYRALSSLVFIYIWQQQRWSMIKL
ncbi:MATE family efflux transporter [Neptuniibacter sp. 1_MG-2023]|jgi:putative MATE family efflux protein|uniref:MATE family efflux transporter n=1 Tax=Neptuniibacter sp. 1_MG-2023 TaxID=3062662 RepID=UPI0026E41A15|nr:MATE family efflux transporter [Neptuniibacter sp. 1_MG-2023]MDO6592266.1 MATE family efflux transporter [Neptuniibacter sp. 1_MG-2023]